MLLHNACMPAKVLLFHPLQKVGFEIHLSVAVLLPRIFRGPALMLRPSRWKKRSAWEPPFLQKCHSFFERNSKRVGYHMHVEARSNVRSSGTCCCLSDGASLLLLRRAAKAIPLQVLSRTGFEPSSRQLLVYNGKDDS